MDLKQRVIKADGLACPHCEGPINFISPYYGRDECDIDNQLVGVWTWWILVPFAELISGFRTLTGNSPGTVKKLYHCVQCNLDLNYKESIKTGV